MNESLKLVEKTFAFYQKSAKTAKLLYHRGFVVYGISMCRLYKHTYYTIIIITHLFTGNPPTITTQPTSQLTTDKISTTLTCEGTGAGTITYHWETSSINEGEWMKISNNNNTKLVANLKQSQQYRCAVSNQFGTTISNVASIIILST